MANINYEPVDRIYRPIHKMVHDNFIGGISWGLGATLGVAIVIGVFTFVFNFLGGLPVVGGFFASIVEATNQALQKR